jgi:hypothetical protein
MIAYGVPKVSSGQQELPFVDLLQDVLLNKSFENMSARANQTYSSLYGLLTKECSRYTSPHALHAFHRHGQASVVAATRAIEVWGNERTLYMTSMRLHRC